MAERRVGSESRGFHRHPVSWFGFHVCRGLSFRSDMWFSVSAFPCADCLMPTRRGLHFWSRSFSSFLVSYHHVSPPAESGLLVCPPPRYHSVPVLDIMPSCSRRARPTAEWRPRRRPTSPRAPSPLALLRGPTSSLAPSPCDRPVAGSLPSSAPHPPSRLVPAGGSPTPSRRSAAPAEAAGALRQAVRLDAARRASRDAARRLRPADIPNARDLCQA